MPITDAVRELILRGASAGEVRRQAVAEGMRSLRQDGWRHVLAAWTTVEEVLRVTKDERADVGIGRQKAGGGG
jgi:type II secretory ATPase GspE/PulE/Tfp pilus assembly ATPase PilB-like protein